MGTDSKITSSKASIQHLGATCGTAIQSTNPALSGVFTPSLWSLARDKGGAAGCMTDLVQAIDIYGSKPGEKAVLDRAVEADLESDTRRALRSPMAANCHLG